MIVPSTATGSLAFRIYGPNFSQQAQVFVDGQAANSTTVLDSKTLFAVVDVTYSTFLGTHQFTVHDGTKTSNSKAFTLYTPQQGPLVMQAVPGYFVGLELDPVYIAAGDVNGDGKADVILQGPVDNFQGSLAILYGQSDGTLSLPQYLAGVSPYSVAVGDIDGNGTEDLVTIIPGNVSGIALGILLGDGHGNFQQLAAQAPFDGIFPGPPYLADLDGDGKPDVVLSVQAPAGVHNIVIWFKNQGGGMFAAPAVLAASAAGDNTTLAVADVNGDGRPDILYSLYNPAPSAEVIHTLVNQGNGQFMDTLTAGLHGVTGIFNVLDFNLDGKPDLVVQVQLPSGNGITAYSFTGNGDGSFSSAASNILTPPLAYEPFQFVAGDFDHDGFPDLAGVDGETEPSHILYLFGDGRGNFTPKDVIGPQGFRLAVADIDGDGVPDVVVPDRFNFVSVSLGRSDRNFPSLLALGPLTSAPPATGDINDDGLPEILVGGDPFSDIPGTVFLNQGNGSLQLAAQTDQSSYMLADLTGRAVVDLLGGNASNLVIWPNNGTLQFGSPIEVPPPVSGYFTVADMDHDGHPDIVGLGEVLYGNSAYQFTPVLLSGLVSTYAIGDFNGDGRLDIATDTFVFLNTGNRAFNAVNAGFGAPGLTQGSTPIVADFNGDGFDDIAIATPLNSGVYIYYSLGDGTFFLGAILDTGQVVGGLPGAWAIAGGDFDGDGRPDIAAGLWDSQQVVVFLNKGGGVYARSFFASGVSTIGMASSDLVRKGKPDLVIANYNVAFRPPNVNVMFHK